MWVQYTGAALAVFSQKKWFWKQLYAQKTGHVIVKPLKIVQNLIGQAVHLKKVCLHSYTNILSCWKKFKLWSRVWNFKRQGSNFSLGIRFSVRPSKQRSYFEPVEYHFKKDSFVISIHFILLETFVECWT